MFPKQGSTLPSTLHKAHINAQRKPGSAASVNILPKQADGKSVKPTVAARMIKQQTPMLNNIF
eukprot:6272585-Amphidinium_carterae.1